MIEKQEVKLVYLTGQYVYDVIRDYFVDVKMKANYNSCVLKYYLRSVFCIYFINLYFALLTHLKTTEFFDLRSCNFMLVTNYFFTLNFKKWKKIVKNVYFKTKSYACLVNCFSCFKNTTDIGNNY